MYTKEDLSNFIKERDKFDETCEHVCKKLSKLDKILYIEYGDCDNFKLSSDNETVYCDGCIYIRNERCESYAHFPAVLLTATDEQIDRYIEMMIAEKNLDHAKYVRMFDELKEELGDFEDDY